jgi:hypothetical protein
LVRVSSLIEAVDILSSVEVVVKRIEVAESFGLKVGDDAGVDEGELLVLPKERFPRVKASPVRESMWNRAFSSIQLRKSVAAS